MQRTKVYQIPVLLLLLTRNYKRNSRNRSISLNSGQSDDDVMIVFVPMLLSLLGLCRRLAVASRVGQHDVSVIYLLWSFHSSRVILRCDLGKIPTPGILIWKIFCPAHPSWDAPPPHSNSFRGSLPTCRCQGPTLLFSSVVLF